MERHLFLDIEDTLTTPCEVGWFAVSCINRTRIRSFIEQWRPTHIHVFSFALWNERERQKFAQIQPFVEQYFGIVFDSVLTVDDDITPACCRVMRLAPSTVPFEDVVNFWGKHESFRLYVRDRWADNTEPVAVALIDDAVIDEEFRLTKLQVEGTIVNVLSL